MSPSFIETRANGRVYILMLEFVDGRVKITSHRSIGDMPADVRRKYLAWVATRRVVAERDSRLPTLRAKYFAQMAAKRMNLRIIKCSR